MIIWAFFKAKIWQYIWSAFWYSEFLLDWASGAVLQHSETSSFYCPKFQSDDSHGRGSGVCCLTEKCTPALIFPQFPQSSWVITKPGEKSVVTAFTWTLTWAEEFLLWLCPSSIRCFLCVIACMYKTGNTNR